MFKSVASIALVCALSAAASAADFSKLVLDQSGKPYKSCAEDTPACKKNVTLGEVCALALSASKPNPNESTLDKIKMGILATRVVEGKDIPLTADESRMIMEAVKPLSPIVVYRVAQEVDPNSVPKAK